MSEERLSPAAPEKSAPLLPADSGRDRPLFAVAAILVFLACLAALGARGAWTVSDGWMADLSGRMTVQILPVDGRDAEADATEAATVAEALPGVQRAVAGTRAEAEALLEPWLGGEGLPADLPVPLLVDIELAAANPATAADLTAALDAAGIPARVDDHARWSEAVVRTARLARLMALGLLLLIAGAAAAVIAFAARASLAARQSVVDALHLVGAKDEYIARLFERRFFVLGIRAGIAGAFFALAIALLVTYGGPGQSDGFIPVWSFSLWDGAVLLLAPVLAGLIAALSARLAVANDLRARW